LSNNWIGEEKVMRKGLFLDIDGCMMWNGGEDTTEIAINLMENKQKVIEGTREKIAEWREKGYFIIITTGRPESLRELTKEQLLKAGIAYDRMICGVPQDRHLINDINSRGNDTAHAHNLVRNAGIKSLDI
jgi:hypothetical protein